MCNLYLLIILVSVGFTKEEITVPTGKTIADVEVKITDGSLGPNGIVHLACVTEDGSAKGR